MIKVSSQLLSQTAKNMLAKSLVLSCAIFLSACDGGIFGTGGADADQLLLETGDEGIISASPIDSETASTVGTQDSVDTVTEGVSSGVDTVTESSGEVVDGATEGTDTITGAETESSTEGATTDSIINAEELDTGIEAPTLSPEREQFINNTVVLTDEAAHVSMYNATALTINAYETNIDPQNVLFSAQGIAPATQSPAVEVVGPNTGVNVFNTNNLDGSVVQTPSFIAEDSTLTNIVIRANDQQVDALLLVTETSTSDPTLSKVRVIQAGTLGNAELSATLQLLSAGNNPGGIDTNFASLNYAIGQSAYQEIPSGQYELVDEFIRIPAQAIELDGGSVYTIMLLGNADAGNSVDVVNDSEVELQ